MGVEVACRLAPVACAACRVRFPACTGAMLRSTLPNRASAAAAYQEPAGHHGQRPGQGWHPAMPCEEGQSEVGAGEEAGSGNRAEEAASRGGDGPAVGLGHEAGSEGRAGEEAGSESRAAEAASGGDGPAVGLGHEASSESRAGEEASAHSSCGSFGGSGPSLLAVRPNILYLL